MILAPLVKNSGTADRRSEPRLRFSWQMYFQHYGDTRVEEGRMLDISSRGAAFLVPSESDVWPGKRVALRITHPMISKGMFTIQNVRREAEVLRVDSHTTGRKRVAVRLIVPLDYDPVGDSPDQLGTDTLL